MFQSTSCLGVGKICECFIELISTCCIHICKNIGRMVFVFAPRTLKGDDHVQYLTLTGRIFGTVSTAGTRGRCQTVR
jgi:hypothetical protein